MSRRLINILLLVVGLSACDRGVTIYAPGEVHRSVKQHPDREGVYLVYYKRHQIIDNFGPGVATVREIVQRANDIDDKLRAWDDALSIAVPRYMEVNHLIPKECLDGIVIISNRGYESGDGTTAFRCK